MRKARARRRRMLAALVPVAAAAAVAGALVLPGMVDGPPADALRDGPEDLPPMVDALPVPQVEAVPGMCEDPAVQAALVAGDDEAVVAAAGGGEAFRAAVAVGAAPCVSLSDVSRQWVVVNKQRPLVPADAAPAELAAPAGVRTLDVVSLRPDAAAALAAMRAGAQAAGAGELAALSAYRSYTTQQRTYAQHVDADGRQVADLESARPGHSEHQTGITVDLVACGEGGCGGLDDFGGSPQGAWVAEHAWEYGFVVRYLEGATEITGYKAEPWHVRYIGPELAKAYRDGGWRSLEEFFGLPAAPDYVE